MARHAVGPAGTVEVLDHRGWEVVRLQTSLAQVDVIPAKGAEIIGLTWRPLDMDVLWHPPAGLPQRGLRGAWPRWTGDVSEAEFLSQYAGGWQTLFPNAGPSVVEQGVTLDFHGEAARVAWEWHVGAESVSVVLTTRLTRAPFSLRRLMTLDGGRLEITETVTSHSDVAWDVMWGHHPAFGAPFLDSGCVLSAAARRFLVDDERHAVSGDLEPGALTAWPSATGRDGTTVDLTRIPGHERPLDRLGYLLDLERGHAGIVNPRLGLGVDLEWDHTVFPCAWYWLDIHASNGFPWYGHSYVLAVEPQSSHPAQGLHAARAKTGSLLTVGAGESRTVTLAATLRSL